MKKLQLQLELKEKLKWGGARKGAGRKPKRGKAGVPHRARAPLASRHPVHVTLRLGDGFETMRTKHKVKAIRRALRLGKRRDGFRLVHFTIQSNHLHFLVEAVNAPGLSKGVGALTIRIARTLNRIAGRPGKVFADRFHARALKTPTEVRNALAYVLLNGARHSGRGAPRLDPCASGMHFDGWRQRPPPAPKIGDEHEPPPVEPPGTWLLTTGWRTLGPLAPNEVPGRK